jgi:hypothetical protein
MCHVHVDVHWPPIGVLAAEQPMNTFSTSVTLRSNSFVAVMWRTEESVWCHVHVGMEASFGWSSRMRVPMLQMTCPTPSDPFSPMETVAVNRNDVEAAVAGYEAVEGHAAAE